MLCGARLLSRPPIQTSAEQDMNGAKNKEAMPQSRYQPTIPSEPSKESEGINRIPFDPEQFALRRMKNKKEHL